MSKKSKCWHNGCEFEATTYGHLITLSYNNFPNTLLNFVPPFIRDLPILKRLWWHQYPECRYHNIASKNGLWAIYDKRKGGWYWVDLEVCFNDNIVVGSPYRDVRKRKKKAN